MGAGVAATPQSASFLSANDDTTEASVAGAKPATFSLQTERKRSLDLTVPDTSRGESSSVNAVNYAANSTLDEVALGADPADPGAGQPPPYRRRRYGRPNRSDRGHNSDGSNKIAFVGGAGFTVPVGSSGKRVKLNYSLKGGAGINFSRKFGILGEFNFDRFGVQGSEITRQFNLYSSLGLVDQSGQAIDFSGLDAKSYIWSITANPIYTFAQTESSSAYVVFGGGFYHRVFNFTLPQVQVFQDPFFGGISEFQSNQTFDHYSNNTGGVNAGIGLTHKLGRFSEQRLYVEARYVYVFDTRSTQSQTSLYPPANFSTAYIPVTVGFRW